MAELRVSMHDKDVVCPTRISEGTAYITCHVLVRLGYFSSITKSVLSMPVNYIKFLGGFQLLIKWFLLCLKIKGKSSKC